MNDYNRTTAYKHSFRVRASHGNQSVDLNWKKYVKRRFFSKIKWQKQEYCRTIQTWLCYFLLKCFTLAKNKKLFRLKSRFSLIPNILVFQEQWNLWLLSLKILVNFPYNILKHLVLKPIFHFWERYFFHVCVLLKVNFPTIVHH